MPSAITTKKKKKRQIAEEDEDEDEDFENNENFDPQDPAGGRAFKSKRSRLSDEKKEDFKEDISEPAEEPHHDDGEGNDDDDVNGPAPFRSINPPGKAAEAGIIKRVYVENFMCHRKLTIDLCRNVNFIHGQNGSGKSAILAAIQICLGAGAKRTHRARNLMELIRKEGDAHRAVVQVTLHNKGADAFHPEIYGDAITIQRIISKSSGNAYKLLNSKGEDPKKSKNARKDLDMLLDQLNIQVENPVAVLDQEEAKKFLCGKPEDKYAFFVKATELERLDKTYAVIKDNIMDMSEACDRIKNDLGPLSEKVQEYEREYKQFEVLEKMEEKLSGLRCLYAWSFYAEAKHKADEEEERLAAWQEKLSKRAADLEKTESTATGDSNEEEEMQQKLSELTKEANEAAAHKDDLREEYKQARIPIVEKQKESKRISKEKQYAKRQLANATRELQNVRDEIMRKAGSAESEEARRMDRMKRTEDELERANNGIKERRDAVDESRRKYDDMDSPLERKKDLLESTKGQFYAVKSKLQELKNNEGNSLAMFGSKCNAMFQQVDHAKRRGAFRGNVIGPIGKFLKVEEGKEELAQMAELVLGGSLDKFIISDKADFRVMQKIRQDVRCNARECGIYQTHDGPRYNVRAPPAGVETICTVLNISQNIVFNCLVDNQSIDQIALSHSKQESEDTLKVEHNGRFSIRGGHIKEARFLPKGDAWRATRGNLNMLSVGLKNNQRFKRTIGVDRSIAIRQTEADLEQLREELDAYEREYNSMKNEQTQFKVRWNNLNRADMDARQAIARLEDTMEGIRAEAAEANESSAIDTSELENDVRESEEAYAKFTEREKDILNQIKDLNPALQDVQAKLDENTNRNEKIVNDISGVEAKLQKCMQSKVDRLRIIKKKRDKVKQVENAIQEQQKEVENRTSCMEKALYQSRQLVYTTTKQKERKKLRDKAMANCEEFDDEDDNDGPTDDDLEAIVPIEPGKSQSAYQNKMTRMENAIIKERDRRLVANTTQEAALKKFQRAKKSLDDKMINIDNIEDNAAKLTDDLRERKKRWGQFRSHITEMTNIVFDEMLNKKGSCGEIEFNHSEHRLNLCVQKDNKDAASQSSDVKALSGGERSYTTLSLLLALGESLETPFRVMDEFDVFLDPVARKIALDTMIHVAKEMEHRQFIFITPQDLSSLKTDPKLKIWHLKDPSRNNRVGGPSQQTIEF